MATRTQLTRIQVAVNMLSTQTHCLLLLGCSLSLLSLSSAQYYYAYPAADTAARAQRSLYGGGWSAPSFSVAPPRLDHITKEEVLALLAAWKEAEAKPEPAKPAPEPEPEKEPEPEPETPEPEEPAEPEPAQPEPAAPARPAPGVPLTVSLPAFVPIQLSAMYTAPVPVGGGLAGLGFGGGAAVGIGEIAAADATATAQAQARARAGTGRAAARIGARTAGPIRFPIANPRSFASANYVASKPRYYRTLGPEAAPSIRNIEALPPPAFLANAPGPVQFVPSAQLFSNWR